MPIRQLDILAYPPAINMILFILAFVLYKRYRRTAIALLSVSFITLLLASLPFVSKSFRNTLYDHRPIAADKLQSHDADAIVILGGGSWPDAREYGGHSVIRAGLNRTRYGAFIARKTGLPIIVSSGDAGKQGFPESSAMRRVLNEEFLIRDVIEEPDSLNTYENAKNSIAIARERGFKKIFLVTSGLHMNRAVKTFKAYPDIEIIPAPTTVWRTKKFRFKDFIPQGYSIGITSRVLHEYIGRAWYWLTR